MMKGQTKNLTGQVREALLALPALACPLGLLYTLALLSRMVFSAMILPCPSSIPSPHRPIGVPVAAGQFPTFST